MRTGFSGARSSKPLPAFSVRSGIAVSRIHATTAESWADEGRGGAMKQRSRSCETRVIICCSRLEEHHLSFNRLDQLRRVGPHSLFEHQRNVADIADRVRRIAAEDHRAGLLAARNV